VLLLLLMVVLVLIDPNVAVVADGLVLSRVEVLFLPLCVLVINILFLIPVPRLVFRPPAAFICTSTPAVAAHPACKHKTNLKMLHMPKYLHT
jgi:hypothetical protein